MTTTLPPQPPDDQEEETEIVVSSPSVPLAFLFLLAASALAGIYAGVFWGVASRIATWIGQ